MTVAAHNNGNSSNGKSAKTLKGSFGTLPIPGCDRNGILTPASTKHQTRFTGFDEHIISLSACGLSTPEIQQHLKEIYHIEVSPAVISSGTDEVFDEVWPDRTGSLTRLPEPVTGESDAEDVIAKSSEASREAGLDMFVF